MCDCKKKDVIVFAENKIYGFVLSVFVNLVNPTFCTRELKKQKLKNHALQKKPRALVVGLYCETRSTINFFI